jgi:hypothetical protein
MTTQFTMPKLGELVHRFDPPWKICGMGWTQFGVMTCTCNNDSRRHSQVYLNNTKIYEDDGEVNSNETIGNPLDVGAFTALVGENGNLWGCDGQATFKRFKTRFATSCCVHNNGLVVLDTNDGKISIRDGLSDDGAVVGTMPGDGIAMSCCSYQGKLYAAVSDSETGACGLSCNDGSLIRLRGCQCVIPFAGQLVYSSLNGIYLLSSGLVTRLDCEKIMDMKVVGNHLYIAGANPDSLWVANSRGEIALVGRVEHGNQTVGGSCFRVRVAVNPIETEGYFGRTANGDTGEVYKIVW